MDLLLVLIWFLIAMGFLLSLIVSSYFVYVRGVRPVDLLARFVLSFIVYALLTSFTGMYAGMLLFFGAHANPAGAILTTSELLICCIALIFYAVAGWVACSFIVGRLIPHSAG